MLFQTSYLFSNLIERYFFSLCHSFMDFIASFQSVLKPQPVLFSYDIYLGLLKEILSKSRLMFFFFTLKHNLSALMILVAITWHEWTFPYADQFVEIDEKTTTEFTQFPLTKGNCKSRQVNVCLFLLSIVLNNRWALSNTPINTTCSRSVLQMT